MDLWLQPPRFGATVLPMGSLVSTGGARGSLPRRGRRASAVLCFASAIGASAFATSPAKAKQEYYDALKDTGTCQDCTLCHSTSPGSLSNWPMSAADIEAKPFYAGMANNGRKGRLPTETMDSDGDSFTDLQELREFGDPNDASVGPGEVECPNQPEYGCLTIAHRAERRSLESAWVGLVLLGALQLRRRTGRDWARHDEQRDCSSTGSFAITCSRR